MESSEVAALRSAGYLARHRKGCGRSPPVRQGRARSILTNFARWQTIPPSAIRSSAACSFPGRRFPRRCAGTTSAATAPAILTNSARTTCRMAVRIVGVADSFDAMTSARPYRGPLSVGSALSDLVRLAPEKFDPNVVQGLADSGSSRRRGQQPHATARRHVSEYRGHRHRSARCHFAAQSVARKNVSHQRERPLTSLLTFALRTPCPAIISAPCGNHATTATFSAVRVHN